MPREPKTAPELRRTAERIRIDLDSYTANRGGEPHLLRLEHMVLNLARTFQREMEDQADELDRQAAVFDPAP